MHSQSRAAHSKVWMCDAPEEEAPAADEEKGSILDSLAGMPAEVLDQIKGMSLMDVSSLIKDAEKTFGVGKGKEDDGEDEAAE